MSNPNPEAIEKELLWADDVAAKGLEAVSADCLASSLPFALLGSDNATTFLHFKMKDTH